MFTRHIFTGEEAYNAINQEWEEEDYNRLKNFSVFYSNNPSIPMKVKEKQNVILLGEEDDGCIKFLRDEAYYIPFSFLDSTIKQLQDIKKFLEEKKGRQK